MKRRRKKLKAPLLDSPELKQQLQSDPMESATAMHALTNAYCYFLHFHFLCFCGNEYEYAKSLSLSLG